MSANDADEIWMPIVEWEGLYEASSLGRVRSIPRLRVRPHPKNPQKLQPRMYGGYVLSPKTHKNGYMAVNLFAHNKGKTVDVHRLVCSAFTGVLMPDMDVNHKNGVRSDNRPENLEWVTRRENLMHAEQVLGSKMVWTHQRERAQARKAML